MTVSMTDDSTPASWFLVNSDAERLYLSVCNYLSLGQFELARSLCRISVEGEGNTMTTALENPAKCLQLLGSIARGGPPESWSCSRTVPSTAHLLSMSRDILKENGVELPAVISNRIGFDLMLSTVLLEASAHSDLSLSVNCVNDIRSRYGVKLVQIHSAQSLVLPRLLLLSPAEYLHVLAGAEISSHRKPDADQQLTGDLCEFIFKLFNAAPRTAPGLVVFLHDISPVISAQLTHITAANVAFFVSQGNWQGACNFLRCLNETGSGDILSSAPLLADLMSLLVFLVNVEGGLSLVLNQKELMVHMHKFIHDCLSPSYGLFPFSAKKRKLVFSLSHLVNTTVHSYVPHEDMRLALYEALSTRESPSPSLLEVASKLEDVLLSLCCDQSTLPACFRPDFALPFWDGYVDFVRMAKVHALGYPLETAVDLIQAKKFQLARQLLAHFNHLKPLAICMCWNDFGADVSSRSALVDELWESYLDSSASCPRIVENAVWLLTRRFAAASLAVQLHSPSRARMDEITIDFIHQLSSKSFLAVIRAPLSRLVSRGVVEAISALPPASSREESTADSVEAKFDLDVIKAYFVLRAVLSLISLKSPPNSLLEEVDSLCESIDSMEVKLSLLQKMIDCCFATMALLEKNPRDRFIVPIGIFFSLVCLVCCHASESMHALRLDAQKLLVRLLMRLRESSTFSSSDRMTRVGEWARLVGADPVLAHRVDSQFANSLPRVSRHSLTESHVSPPRLNMSISPEFFVPRLTCCDEDLVRTAMMLNDYTLADELVRFYGLPDSLHADIAESRRFAEMRDQIHLEGASGVFLTDLAVCCASAGSDVSLRLLRDAHRELCSSSGSDHLAAWTSKLAVLLEAKSEFSSNVSVSDAVSLSELLIGIETLPSEPELLKDHLNRMHSQRSAIMSLVNRVDQARKGQVKDGDFLSDAISRLSKEEGSLNEGSFLLKFLEYLGQVCSLVQSATPVSLFDILSEEPVDVVARMVFEHARLAEAASLCELMRIDLLSIVETQTVCLGSGGGKFFISIEIVEQVERLVGLDDPSMERLVIVCVERRSERWPSSSLLEYSIDNCKNPVLRRWIEERRDCWIKFVWALIVLYKSDVSQGFTVMEQELLGEEPLSALESVSSDSQSAMDALARMVARAHIAKRDFIAALGALDERLSLAEDPLIQEALMGCLEVNSHLLSPVEILELLWRVPVPSTLCELTFRFTQDWESDVALRALSLCASRLEKGEDLERVVYQIRIIRTMSFVVDVIPEWTSWQRLAHMLNQEECEQVITGLIDACEHSLACDFLDLKSSVFELSFDREADRIELSRLQFIFLATVGGANELVQRLKTVHHPLKASRLGLDLMQSLEDIFERIRLGQVLISNRVPCEEDAGRIETQLAALALFKLTNRETISQEWRNLLERPDLIFESLLMNGQTSGLHEFLSEFPSWRNDELLLHLAEKAMLAEPESFGPSVCANLGLGGRWSLSGEIEKDEIIRSVHRFDRYPDMRLALRLIRLTEPSCRENAEKVFEFANRMSEYIPGFFVNDVHACPFTHYEYLRQAIVGLVDLLRDPSFDFVRLNIRSNMDLIRDLQSCEISVGLKDLSDPDTQEKLRDRLIGLDALDLAERVCYASGKTSDRARRAADVVTIRRACLCIQMNDQQAASYLLKEQLNSRKLTSDQLAELEAAVRSKNRYSIQDLKKAHAILSSVALDRRLRPHDGHSILVDYSSLSRKVRELLPKTRARKVSRFVVPSHMRGELYDTCTACTSIEETEFSRDVCIQTPTRWVEEGQIPVQAQSVGLLEESDLLSLRTLFETFGTLRDVISLLLREGLVEEAVERAMQSRKAMDPSEFVSIVSSSLTDSKMWIDVLNAMRNSKESFATVIQYLTAIESHLRRTEQYQYVYAYEVSMGREAQAGLVAVQLYLRADTWETRLGWLESADRHLSAALIHRTSRRNVQRYRRRQAGLEGTLSSSDEEEIHRIEDRKRIYMQENKITVPFNLPSGDVFSEPTILAVKSLVELEKQIVTLLPNSPGSASLFGSIQSVSELIDYLLMEGHVGLSKLVVARLRLPDSVLCGIF